MEKKCLRVLIFALAAVFMLMGCAAPKPMVPQKKGPVFKAVNLNPKVREGKYVQKVQNFMVVLDASGTMLEISGDQPKFSLAKDLIMRMNHTIPSLRLTAGLRTFGKGFGDGTDLLYGLTDYSKPGLEGTLGKVVAGGFTPLGRAIGAAIGDLKSTQGNIAVIIFSDGLETDRGALAAAKKMKGQFGERLCIYTVLLGNDPAGKNLMEQVAQTGECGFSVGAYTILSSSGMADFVEKVFLTKMAKPMDSDGDGVPDDLDRCPNTPKGVKVDEKGCPPDSDGDGVPDYFDHCPRTPKGARVNEVGCWVITDADMKNVEFDFNKWNIKPRFYPALDHVVAILEENLRLKVEIQGHTDSMGSEAYNQGLSEKRARAVMNYLINKGISRVRLSSAGYGESKPIATNETEEGRARNRRVQLRPIY